MTGYDALLFDFDGVLADTEPLHWECWCAVLNPLGVRLDWATFEPNCIGISDVELFDFFANLAPQPLSREVMHRAYSAKCELYRRIAPARTTIPADIVSLINGCTNYLLGVVTSSKAVDVVPILDRAGIRSAITVLVTADDVPTKKPSPAPYLFAAKRLRAGSPLVIEDSVAGVASATAAGFDVIRVKGPSEVVGAVRSRLAIGQKDGDS